jgi:hypothetical protein
MSVDVSNGIKPPGQCFSTFDEYEATKQIYRYHSDTEKTRAENTEAIKERAAYWRAN